MRQELLRDDPEGAVLEAYLDRRFAGWRQAERVKRQGRGGGGAMSRERRTNPGPAQGASRREIVPAHRSLMKKLHPDHGGSTALAAQVNEAKDVLLGTG